ncbi:MAG: ABC transporter ATP-binding protein [Gluconacetobacter diazotrophicus]|nr:ABC transporter ATP-binding protein [Gluconacetobacter diazotrophicus]
MIELRNVEKCVPQRGEQFLYLLRHINLTVREGDFVSLMGPSGAGKSTLLHILGLQDQGWTGEYEFDGQPVHRLKPKERNVLRNANVGFIFQSFHLLDDLTVYENLDLPLSYRDIKPADRAGIIGDALDRFRIVGKKDLYPSQLSGGQQQLVGVVRAVIARPKLLIADEPTGNLHSAQGDEIMSLFQELNAEGMTIVQATHSEANAARSGRIIRLQDGWMEK